MTVQDVLNDKGKRVWTISPDAKVIDALRLMSDKDIGAIVVTRDEDLVGILTERDYARKVMLMGKSSLDTPVKDIMTSGVGRPKSPMGKL